MSKAEPFEAIMAADRLKGELALSKRTMKPVQAAFGLTGEGDAVLVLDKLAKPTRMLPMLRTAAAKANIRLNTASLRFGMAEVGHAESKPDGDEAAAEADRQTLQFTVNKDVPGQERARLLELARHLGFHKIEINVDSALGAESEDDAAPQPTAASLAAPVALADAASLTAQLRDLIGQITHSPDDSAHHRAECAALAAAAGAGLKAHDLAGAAEAIARLRDLLASPPGDAARVTAGTPADAEGYAKARLIWLAARRSLNANIDKVGNAIGALYADTGLGEEITARFRTRVQPVLDKFDTSLADTLDAASKQADPGQRSALLGAARASLGRYESYLASEPLLGLLDENPFESVRIAPMLSETLQALARLVHAGAMG